MKYIGIYQMKEIPAEWEGSPTDIVVYLQSDREAIKFLAEHEGGKIYQPVEICFKAVGSGVLGLLGKTD